MKTVYLGLGSNLGDRGANLQAAIERLASPELRVLRVSPVYETEPMYLTAQPRFLNQVIEVETELFPRQLLTRINKVERAMGRVRAQVNGPRIIDVDILLYGDAVIRSPGLEVPHPKMTERRFVLEPLAALSPDLRIPGTKKTVRELLVGQSHAPLY